MGRRFRGDAGPMDTGTDRQSFCFGVDFFIQIWYKQQKIYVRYNIAMGKSIAAYERKLRKQAEEFFNQMKDVQEERDEYERLLNEYEKYIKELEIKCAASELIQETEKIYQNLRKLKSA